MVASPDEELRRQAEMVAALPLVCEAFATVGECVFILNESRRVVYANAQAARHCKTAPLGGRLGNVIGCIHAQSEDKLCGSGPACPTCGIFAALVNAGGMQAAEHEVTLAKERGQAANLRVRVSPVTVAGEDFVVAAFADTSATRRRVHLEGVFFHDILNMAAALKGLAELYDWGKDDGHTDVLRELGGGAQWLVDEIAGFEMLAAAEKDELQPEFQKTWLPPFLREVLVRAETLPRARGRRLAAGECPELALITDRRVLSLVLLRMIERVLEATSPGGEVAVGASSADGVVRFAVRGPGGPLPDVNDAGLLSYSMQLFSQKYLEGRVVLDPARTAVLGEFPLVPSHWVEEREQTGTPASS